MDFKAELYCILAYYTGFSAVKITNFCIHWNEMPFRETEIYRNCLLLQEFMKQMELEEERGSGQLLGREVVLAAEQVVVLEA